MERSLKKTSKPRKQRTNAPAKSEQAGGGKDHASAAYDEYLWLLQQRNRLLKKLKTKDEQQVELERKEQGFALYINGANRDNTNLLTSRQTKTADEHSSSRHLLLGELQPEDKGGEIRAKTAPTKLTRKEWKPAGIKIKTEQGTKIDVKAPGKITGIYSEDFDGLDDETSESEDIESSSTEDSDSGVERLSLSFKDVHKLRRSLEMDTSIKESIQTVIEGESFNESDEGDENHDIEKTKYQKPGEHLDIKDIEDTEDEEEVEEELEIGNTSLNIYDSQILENIPNFSSSYVVSKNAAGGREDSESEKSVLDHDKTEEDTVVLTFSKNKSQKRHLSATRRNPEVVPQPLPIPSEKRSQSNTCTKTIERQRTAQVRNTDRTRIRSSSKQLSDLPSTESRGSRPLSGVCKKKLETSVGCTSASQDVLQAVALENEEVEKFQESSRQCNTGPETSLSQAPSCPGASPSSVPTNNSITDQTIVMVTKRVRNMDASQQKQLLELLGKLDPLQSQRVTTSSPKINPSIAFASPELSPTQPLSPTPTTTSAKEASPVEKEDFLEVCFEIRSNWGHPTEVGLTEVQFFSNDGSLINVPTQNIHLTNGISNEISLENLVNGKTKTTGERYMWKYPYEHDKCVELLFQVPCQWGNDGHNVSKIKIWNYNKKMKELNVGVKNLRIFTGAELAWEGNVDKGCGNQIYDYAEVVNLKTKQQNKIEDVMLPELDPVIRSETVTLRRSQDELPLPSSPTRLIPVVADDFKTEPPVLPEKDSVELQNQQSCLEEIKEKRSASFTLNQPHSQGMPKWLDSENDHKRDNLLTQEFDLLDQPKNRSRPSSGRRSSRKQSPESRRTTPRPECGRRSANTADQEQESLEQQLTKLCVGELSTEGNPVEQERLLEESLNSLSQFRRCHQGRITPSNKIELDQQGDALDDLLTPIQQRSSDQGMDVENTSPVDDFVIPELPSGQHLVINILSTWGDQYYVGLNGVEIFSNYGKPVQISKITADPLDINILPEYSKDPRVVSNLIDGVYCTRDDMHLWMAPFAPGKNHFIYIDFKEVSTLAMIRIWNYNKSRIHSFRGAKDVEIFLDDNLIFRGEMARASGELGSSETFGDTILFTMNDAILEAMAANDQTYEPDLDEDEDYLQTSDSFKRPITADKGIDPEPLERPYTCPKERKKPTVEPTFPNKIVEDMNIDVIDGESDVCNRQSFGRVLELNFVSTWGDMYYLGLTGLEVLGNDGHIIPLSFDMLQASPRDLNDLPEYEDDDRTLDKLIDGENVTMSDEHMWLIPFTPGGNHLLTITLKELTEITGLRLWNYNKSPESTYRGAKSVMVKLDGKIIASKDGILIRKGPGNCNFDFVQNICFLKSQKKPWKRQNSLTDCNTGGDCELTVKPCGFVFQFQLFGSWADPYYLGLNGVQFFDENGEMIQLSRKNVTAYPDSVNVLQGVKDDVRTPEKLIDGVNDTDDGRHMWLAPVFPGLTNLLYFVFDEPVTISMIKVWNYRKTPIRGVRQFSILVDDLLVFNGILPQVPTGARGILPNMDIPVPHSTVLFTDNEEITKKEKRFAINAGGYFENQEVSLVNDKTDSSQNRQTTREIDQALRPKTSVTNLARPRR